MKVRPFILLLLACLPFMAQANISEEDWVQYETEYNGEKFAISFPKEAEVIDDNSGKVIFKCFSDSFIVTLTITPNSLGNATKPILRGILQDTVEKEKELNELYYLTQENQNILEYRIPDKELPSKSTIFRSTYTPKNRYIYFITSFVAENDDVRNFFDSFQIINEGIKDVEEN